MKKKTHILNNTRIEKDLLDTREVPADAHYGVHTLRAIENFYISNDKISDTPEFVRGMVMVKKAAAMANKELQTIPKSIANTIIAACDEAPNNGKCMGQFSVNVYRGDASTSVSMSTNEVLANIGLELMGHQKGEYQYPNPNDHVSRCQSTNGAYPTGFRIAVYSSLIKLVDTISQLHEDFERKAVEFQNILEVGRTQLQDAVPMTLGREFRVFSILLKEEVKSIQHTAELLLGVDLGATAIDTGLNTPEECFPLAVKKLVEIIDFPCVPAGGLTEATFDCSAYIMVHDALKRLAVKMSKTCSGLHLLPSGPRADLNEINLPELQTGPPIMSTKVDPVVPEVINQVCFKVVSNDTTVTMAAKAGQPQLNITKPVTNQTMFESIRILTNACYSLLGEYANGITASKGMCKGCVYSSIGIVTYLNPFIGHHSGDIAGKICAETGRSVYEVVLERGLLTEAEPDDIFSVQSLMHPACETKRCTDESEQ